MRDVLPAIITDAVRRLCLEAAVRLEPDVTTALRGALDTEESPLGKDALEQIIKNFEIAEKEDVPICQDTGIAVFFIEVGSEVSIKGSLEGAVNEGVRRGYKEGHLRNSVCDPLNRKNTGDNTPAIIHLTIVEGDRIKIRFAPKGAGSENMSALRMLKPADGVEGIKKIVLDSIASAQGNPCPPIVVGIGIGGNFELSAILSKKALLRSIGMKNPSKEVALLETELLLGINKLGIGPMGFGGTITALAVHIETAPCHIASLPIAINIQCHADRHKETVI
ncbi:MAG: fumarate hydratase [Deltaproteobacteria bacterium]|nr:fumarate hydratase [Deltaproteobacteria bacterium]